MAEQGNNKFSTREWWMFIILIVLIQWLIHFWSTEALSSSAMVNYVSFAGTLASTILAVLAIIYSFVQSASQQTTSETISREVHRLQSIVSSVNESTSKVNESLEKLPHIIEQLENIPSTVSETINQGVSPLTQSHTKITEMMTQMLSGSGNSRASSESKSVGKINTDNEVKKLYVITPVVGLALSAYIILNDKSINEMQDEFMSSVSRDNAHIVSGIFYSARGALLGLCLQQIFELEYGDKLKRRPDCSDDIWDEMISNQNVIMSALSNVINGDGINSVIPRDIQEKIKSTLFV